MKFKQVIIGITAFLLVALTLVLFTNRSGASKKNSPKEICRKVLVAYFTSPEPGEVDASSGASRIISNGNQYGNTEYMAHIISEATGGDLFAIQTVQTYPHTHEELIEAVRVERESKARPELSTHISNLNEYDVIFVGYPNWFFDIPMPLYTFFEEYDFKGKTIVPFYTYGRSGKTSNSVDNITSIVTGATIIPGLSVSRDSIPQERENIENWIQNHGFIKQ